MEDLSSKELMLKCKRGEVRAFDILMKRHEPGLIAYLGEKLLDREGGYRDHIRAEDLAQEAFLRAFEARERYVPSAKFTTWLYRIALNLYRDEIRRRTRHPTISLSREYTMEDADGEEDVYELHEAIPDASLPSAQEILEQAEQEHLLKAAIATLPPKHQEVLALRYHEVLYYAEIAERRGCPLGTVKSRPD